MRRSSGAHADLSRPPWICGRLRPGAKSASEPWVGSSLQTAKLALADLGPPARVPSPIEPISLVHWSSSVPLPGRISAVGCPPTLPLARVIEAELQGLPSSQSSRPAGPSFRQQARWSRRAEAAAKQVPADVGEKPSFKPRPRIHCTRSSRPASGAADGSRRPCLTRQECKRCCFPARQQGWTSQSASSATGRSRARLRLISQRDPQKRGLAFAMLSCSLGRSIDIVPLNDIEQGGEAQWCLLL